LGPLAGTSHRSSCVTRWTAGDDIGEQCTDIYAIRLVKLLLLPGTIFRNLAIGGTGSLRPTVIPNRTPDRRRRWRSRRAGAPGARAACKAARPARSLGSLPIRATPTKRRPTGRARPTFGTRSKSWTWPIRPETAGAWPVNSRSGTGRPRTFKSWSGSNRARSVGLAALWTRSEAAGSRPVSRHSQGAPLPGGHRPDALRPSHWRPGWSRDRIHWARRWDRSGWSRARRRRFGFAGRSLRRLGLRYHLVLCLAHGKDPIRNLFRKVLIYHAHVVLGVYSQPLQECDKVVVVDV
jgi:hypothetical protein